MNLGTYWMKKHNLKILTLMLIILYLAITPVSGLFSEEPEPESVKINLNDSQNIYYNLVWNKHFEGPIIDSDISSDGKTIAMMFGILPGLTTYLLDEKNELIWQNNNLGISAARISPEGKCFAIPDADKIYVYPDFLPVKRLRAIRMYWYLDVSSNCDFISYMDRETKKIYLRSKDGKELWSSRIEIFNSASLTMSKNADYILASISNRGLSSQTPAVYLFDKNGKLLWNVEKSFGSSSISLNGKYIVGSSDSNLARYPRNIYEYNTKGDILKKFEIEIPEQTGVEIRKISIADNGVIAAYFSDDNNKIKSSVFLIDIDGQLLWKKEFDSQITAMSMSAYGSHIVIGTKNGDLYYFVGKDVGNPIEVEQEVQKEDPMNPILIVAGFLAFGIISVFVALPYYKRSKLKKEMEKTPTDWCPECHKFTGGAPICPHCHHKTLIETKYDTSKKAKKK